MPNLIWADPASQATYGLEFWSATANASVESTVVKYGVRSTKVAGGGATGYVNKEDVGADAGRRVTGWFRFANLPVSSPEGYIHLHGFGQALGFVIALRLGFNGVLELENSELNFVTDADVKASSGAALVINTWYRITLSYVIAAVDNWDAKVYVDGNLVITASEADFNLERAGSSGYMGVYDPDESVTAYISPIVFDDGTDLADPGDLRVIHAPYAAESANNFDTAVGAVRDASDYTNVSERPLSETNGWRHNAADVVEESYILEQTLAALDVNLTGKTIAGRMAWIWAKGGTSDVKLINNGSDITKTLTATSALYTDITTSATYPTGAFGMKSSGTADDTFFYEGGCLIVWLSRESDQFIDRLPITPTAARRALYESLIDALVFAGVWTKLDALYVFAAFDEWTARTNLISRYFDLENQGAPVFGLTHLGYTGPANTAKFLNTQFNSVTSTGQYARDDASMGTFSTAGPASSADSGPTIGHFSGQSVIVWPQATDNKFYWLSNSPTYQDVVTPASTGMFSWSRTGANAVVAYRNGAQIDTAADASAALVEQSFQILRGDSASTAAATKLGAAFFGKGLTSGEHLALYNALSTFITAVNAADGSAVPVVLGATASTVIDDGVFNATPGLALLQDGTTLFCVYAQSTDSAVTDAIWRYKTSTDSGATWSAATTLYTAPAGFVALDVDVMVHSSGAVIVSGYLLNEGDQHLNKVIVLRGTANLSSFSAAITASEEPDFAIGVASTSKAIELTNGDLVLPVYGVVTGDTFDSVGVVKSSDDGVTWGDFVVAIRGSDDESYNEANGVLFGSRIVLIARHDQSLTETGYVRSYSDNGGATWSLPAQIIGPIALPGRPAVVAIGADRMFMWARFSSVCKSRWGVSYDAGVSWSPFTPIDASTTEQYFYASCVLIAADEIGTILARQRTADDAFIVYRNFDYDSSIPVAEAVLTPVIRGTIRSSLIWR